MTSANAVHIRTPKPFGGKANEDFKSWSLRLEHYFTLAGTNDEQKLPILLLNLEGTAYRTAEKLGAVEAQSYAAAVQLLVNHYVTPENKNEYRMKFASRDMHAIETYEAYARELRLFAAEAYPDFNADALEELTIQRFIKGIRTPVTSQRIFLRDCKKLNDAVQYAKLSEAAFALHKAPQRSFTASTSGRSDVSSRMDGTAYSAAADPQQSSFGDQRGGHGRKSVRCYNCQNFGHIAKECTAPKQPSQESSGDSSYSYRQPNRGASVSSVNRGSYRGIGDGNYRGYGDGIYRGNSDGYYRGNSQRYTDGRSAYSNRPPPCPVHSFSVNRGGMSNRQSVASVGGQECEQGECDENVVDEIALELASSNFMVVHGSNAVNRSVPQNMFVAGKINATPVNYMMVDSGSTVTLTSETLWLACKRPQDTLAPIEGSYIAANGNALNVIGKAIVTIQVAGLSVRHEVIVVRGLAQHSLLGSDFLKRHKVDILTSIMRLCSPFGQSVIRFEYRAAQSNVVIFEAAGSLYDRPIHATVECVLPPMTEIVPEVIVDSPLLCNLTYVAPSECSERIAKLAVAHALSECAPTTKVLVPNWANCPITVAKDRLIAGVAVISNDECRNANSTVTLQDEPNGNARDSSALSQQTHSAQTDQLEVMNVSLRKETIDQVIASLPLSLSVEQKESLRSLLNKHAVVVSAAPHDVGCTNIVEQSVDTGNAARIKQSSRRIPYCQMDAVDNELPELKPVGIISQGSSSWASPIVIVRKSNGDIHTCVDYRKLNAFTVRNARPLPCIDDMPDALSCSTIFTSFYYASGCFNIAMNAASNEKTAIVTPFVSCAYNRMAFGKQAFACPDDDIVYAQTFDEHTARLELVLQRFKDAKLKIRPAKSSFCQPSFRFLGHIADQHGIKPDEAKLQKVKEWPIPKGVDHIRSFLGLASYYRRFVRDFAHISKPLVTLLEADVPFEWSVERDKAFKTLKAALLSPPILVYTNFDKPLILDSDASDFAASALLSQIGNDGLEHPVAFYSKLFSKPELNYSVTRKELLALVDAMEQFRVYLLGRKFTARSDHSALKWLQSFREPTGQVARWIERLAEFDYVIQHRPGRLHGNADALSRYPVNALTVIHPEYTLDEIADMQKEDRILSQVGDWLKKGQRPTDDEVANQPPESRLYWARVDMLVVPKDVVYLQQRSDDESKLEESLLLPQPMRLRLLQTAQSRPGSGHLGTRKTYEKLRTRLYWWHMYEYVQAFVRACATCSQRKTNRRNHAPLQSVGTGWPCQRIGVDFVGPIPGTAHGNRFILAGIDYFTRWSEAFPLKRQDAETTAHTLVTQIVARYGMPYIMHSDRSAQFESSLLRAMCEKFDIARTRTTAYHPQGNGMTERQNRTLIEMLATSAEEASAEWDNLLDIQLMAYRSSLNESTGYTPFFLMIGREMQLPLDCIVPTPDNQSNQSADALTQADKYHAAIAHAYEIARENMGLAQNRQQSIYDRRTFGKRFAVGERVWLHNSVKPKGLSAKFHHPWTGPWVVIDQLSDVDYKIKLPESRQSKIVHFYRLKKCHKLPAELVGPASEGDSSSSDSDDDFVIGRSNPNPPVQQTAADVNGPLDDDLAVHTDDPATPSTSNGRDSSQDVIALGCAYFERDTALAKWINGTLRAYLEQQVASQAIHGRYRDSMNVSYTTPPGLRDENDKATHPRKRQIFDVINLILGITGAALGGYNTAQIAALQSRQDEIVVHINQVVRLVETDRNFHHTIYWDNPADPCQFATVHPIYPLRQHAIGYVLRIPRTMRAGLTLLYDVTAVGRLTKDRKYAMRPKLHAHPVYDSIGLGTSCDQLRYRVRRPQASTSGADEYCNCLRNSFRVPELTGCKEIDDSVCLCPHQYAIRRSTCLTNSFQCSWESKMHSDTEMIAGRYAYAIRTTEQSYHVKQLQESPTERISSHGFLSEPRRRAGLISCGPISCPLKLVEFLYQFDYKECKVFTPPTIRATLTKVECTGQEDMVDVIQTMECPPLLSVIRMEFSSSEVTISIVIVMAPIIVIVTVATVTLCYYEEKSQHFADVVTDEKLPIGSKIRTVRHQAGNPRRRLTPRKFPKRLRHKKAPDRHEETGNTEHVESGFGIAQDATYGSINSFDANATTKTQTAEHRTRTRNLLRRKLCERRGLSRTWT
jgi:transposase InsO family protein